MSKIESAMFINKNHTLFKLNKRFTLSKNSECRNGTFGVRCTHTCTENCLNNEICNKSDGGCRNCAPGWEGHLCDKSKNLMNISILYKAGFKMITISNYNNFVYTNVDYKILIRKKGVTLLYMFNR